MSALDYSALHLASAPDLLAPSALVSPSGQSFFAPGRYGGGPAQARARGGPAGAPSALLAVQRSPASAAALGGARAAARAVRRSPSMHARMRRLVQSAKERSLAPQGSQELVTLRWGFGWAGSSCAIAKHAAFARQGWACPKRMLGRGSPSAPASTLACTARGHLTRMTGRACTWLAFITRLPPISNPPSCTPEARAR